ncbi:MAG: shikimate dehydrogenase [Chloroflexota bacterium]
MIDGKTNLVGVIGMPIEHTLSPIIHNAAFEKLGLNWCYLPLPVFSENIKDGIQGLVALGFRGVNVTAPHKQAVIPYLDQVDPETQELGAVNTLVMSREDNKTPYLTGYNTDVAGFLTPLIKNGFDPKDKKVVIIGSGGSASAVIFGLLSKDVKEIKLLNRSLERINRLKEKNFINNHRINIDLLNTDTLIESVRWADLLVNTTPVGTFPKIQDSIWPDKIPVPSHLTVYDLVYNPLETKLLRQARQSKAFPIGGLDMLICQAALSFEMWTGLMPPIDIMKIKAHEYFSRR